jgi:hypothetical protein
MVCAACAHRNGQRELEAVRVCVVQVALAQE